MTAEAPYDYARERFDAENAALRAGYDRLPRRMEASRYMAEEPPSRAELESDDA